MSNYGLDNEKRYDDYEDEENEDYYDYENEGDDEYYDSIYYDLIQENNEYGEATIRSKDGWFYDEEPRTLGDNIGKIY